MHRIEAYITLGLIFIAIISVLYLPILFYLKKKGISVIRQISYLGLFCSIFLIAFATILFVPINFHPENYTLNLIPFNWIREIDGFDKFIVEKLPNILLFIPFGFFIPTVLKNKRKFYNVFFIGFTTTFSIEFFQYFIGRSSDIDDVLTNLLGAVIGYAIFRLFDNLLNKKKIWNKFIGNNT